MAHDLSRFIAAQDHGGTWERARAELAHGRKASHWMWFVFPQIAGLGRSPTAVRYAIGDADEARAYAAHPLLGARLREAIGLACAARGSAEEMLGGIDAVKLRSSLTLFAAAVPEEPIFAAGLDRFFGGEHDPATLKRLAPGA